MKKPSKLLGVLFATGMLLGACDKAASDVNPNDGDGATAHVHSFGDWVETPATCKEAGKKERVCACGEKESEVLPKLTTHTFGEWEEVDPATCKDPGKKERVCSVCGAKEEEELPKLTTHTFGDWVETPATYEADGLKERVCSVCGEKEQEVIPMLVKTWGDNDRAILDNYFYGIDLPYMEIEGETEFEYDARGKEAEKTAPVCSAEILAAYYAKFGAGYVDNGSEVSDSKMIYRLTGVVETEAGDRYVDIYMFGYAEDENGKGYITADGSGMFVLDIVDPYVYALSDTYINLIAYYYFDEEVEIPDLECYAYYEDDSSEFNSSKTWYTLCFGDPDEIFDEIAAKLMSVGFEYAGRDSTGYYCFVPQDQEILVALGYIPSYGLVAIRVTDLPGLPEINGDVLSGATFNVNPDDTSYQEYTLVADSGAEYLAFASSNSGFVINARDNHGIVVTKSIGTVNGVKIQFNEECPDTVTVKVYGSNDPFTTADMYDETNAKNLVLLGTLYVDADFLAIMQFQTEYAYIGFKAEGGGAFIDAITISWTVPEPNPNPENGGGEGGGEGQGQGEGEGNGAGEGAGEGQGDPNNQ